MIGVALADDQTLVRQGIKSLLDLTPDLRVVAEASDGSVVAVHVSVAPLIFVSVTVCGSKTGAFPHSSAT